MKLCRHTRLFFLILFAFFTRGMSAHAALVDILDPNFKAFLTNQHPEVLQGGQLDTDAAAMLLEMDCSGQNINLVNDVVKYFTGLKSFNCSDNNLLFLDVADLQNLEKLYCDANDLLSLSLPINSNITLIRCQENNLNSINLTWQSNLESIWCYSNNLTAIDVQNNPNLLDIRCADNQITSIDVSLNEELIILACSNKGIGTLDVTQNQKLEWLSCTQCDLIELKLDNPLLEELIIDMNDLPNLDISKSPKIWYLSCFDNQLTGINLGNNKELEHLNINNNNLGEIDVSSQESLLYLNVSFCNLSSFDVSKNTKLKHLSCIGNQLGELNLSNNNQLEYLGCAKNKLSVLDLTNKSLLEQLYCFENELTTLLFPENNQVLNLIMCADNKLTFEDLLPILDEPFYNILDFFSYAPQDSVGEKLLIPLNVGANYDFQLGIDPNVPDNAYTWFHDGIGIDFSNENHLLLENLQLADEGAYYAEIKNPNLEDLILISYPHILVLEKPPTEITSFSATCQNDVIGVIGFQTNFEANSDYFTLYKSLDQENWEEIAAYAGNGNGVDPQFHEIFNENEDNAPIVYYKLVVENEELQEFTDSAFTELVACFVDIQEPLDLEVYEFNLRCEEGTVNISANFLNHEYHKDYLVENSTDGINWDLFYTISASDLEAGFFNYKKKTSFAKTAYFRIRKSEEVISKIMSSACKPQIPSINVFPNPASQYIEVNLPKIAPATIRIMNILGAEMVNQNFVPASGNQSSFRVYVDQLLPGSYFIKVSQGTLEWMEKIQIFH